MTSSERALGTKLMETLIQAARDRHVLKVTGQVLTVNVGMTQLRREPRFRRTGERRA